VEFVTFVSVEYKCDVGNKAITSGDLCFVSRIIRIILFESECF
jgi:hypothetical protein